MFKTFSETIRKPASKIIVFSWLYMVGFGFFEVEYIPISILGCIVLLGIDLRIANLRPSSLATYLLYLLLSKQDRETIPGDLEEEFTKFILPKFGAHRAWLWYWVQTVLAIGLRNPLCRWFFIGGGLVKLGEWITRKIGG